jgi:hypothetical protein
MAGDCLRYPPPQRQEPSHERPGSISFPSHIPNESKNSRRSVPLPLSPSFPRGLPARLGTTTAIGDHDPDRPTSPPGAAGAGDPGCTRLPRSPTLPYPADHTKKTGAKQTP